MAALYGVKSLRLVGGESKHAQRNHIEQLVKDGCKVDIAIATPGRLLDMVEDSFSSKQEREVVDAKDKDNQTDKNAQLLSLEHVSILILDEFDKLIQVATV